MARQYFSENQAVGHKIFPQRELRIFGVRRLAVAFFFRGRELYK
jgi:hypothetical protein